MGNKIISLIRIKFELICLSRLKMVSEISSEMRDDEKGTTN
jgi:hypothetical protein